MAPGLLENEPAGSINHNAVSVKFQPAAKQATPADSLQWQQQVEQHLIEQPGIKQAKVLESAEFAADGPRWTVVLSLEKSASSDDSLTIKSARKALLKRKKGLGGNAFTVPKQWLVIDQLPLSPTGFVDESALRRMLAAQNENVATKMEIRRIADGLITSSVDGMSTNEPRQAQMEKILKFLWAQVLNIYPDDIGRRDSFLRLGGDSVTAIQLIAMASEYGISITAAVIFQSPRLADMALAMKIGVANTMSHIKPQPYSLLPTTGIDELLHQARKQCNLGKDQEIEDAYPCTSFQEGVMALSVKQPGSYVTRQVYRLPSHVDTNRFRVAWERTVQVCTNLRTRIVFIGGSSIQLVIKDDVKWSETGSLDEYSAAEGTQNVGIRYGMPLCSFALVRDDAEDAYQFAWEMHHAIFDGWTVKFIFDVLYRMYSDPNGASTVQLRPYTSFIRYTESLDSEGSGSYWKQQLQGAKKASFPPSAPSSQASTSKDATRYMRTTIPFHHKPGAAVTKASILRATWAILLAKYCDSDDICFGTTVSGRQASVPGLEAMAGPTIATVPIRVQINRSQSVASFLDGIQTQALAMISHEQFGLRNISKLGTNARDACEFSSLLVIQPALQMTSKDGQNDSILDTEDLADGAMRSYFNYPLLFQIQISDEQNVELVITYDSDVLAEQQVTALTRQFDHVLQQILFKDDALVGSISVAGSWDLQQATRWNEGDSKAQVMDNCVHDLITAQARRVPEREAIYTTEGSMTYAELDDASTKLAHYLCTLGVSLETIVPLCFEKGIWAIVAMVGVLKAGGAFLSLDPSHPLVRRQGLIEEVNAEIVLTSPRQASACDFTSQRVIALSEALISEISKHHDVVQLPGLPAASAGNAAYVLFTSGSTGVPKGTLMEHGSTCTTLTALNAKLAVCETTRVLQFASYCFDVCITDIFGTLLMGGTICVPTDEERLYSTASFMTTSRVNMATLTCCFARTLNPTRVPTLETLIFAGDALTKDLVDKWTGFKLFNAYGPTETCTCTVRAIDPTTTVPTNIGRGFNCASWVVDPDDHEQLAPIGCIGELIIYTFNATRGYINHEELTKRSFLDEVNWLPSVDGRRFYKTGDLVRYLPDGNLEYIGRRDTQVKIRGRRTDLSEIETAIATVLPDAKYAAVELVQLNSRDKLIAFICVPEEDLREVGGMGDTQDLRSTVVKNESMLQVTTSLAHALHNLLPEYMVPSIFLPLRSFPLTASMKVDRKRLRALIGSLSTSDLATFSLADQQEKTAPSTDMEVRIQYLWAEILKALPEEIGTNDNFFQIGGDSISAMELVTLAQGHGIGITVAQVFEMRQLAHLAAAATTVAIDDVDGFDMEPFGLLSSHEIDTLKSHASKSCQLSTDQTIEDAYPCTPLQEGLMALTEKQSGLYVAHQLYKLPKDIDIRRFRAAWERTVDLCANLRTRIIRVESLSVQVVIQSGCTWEPTIENSNSEDAMGAMTKIQLRYGTPLCRYALVEDRGEYYFAWRMHHAIFDGWTLQIALDVLQRAYDDFDAASMQIRPFAVFVNYTESLKTAGASEFWQNQLQDAKRANFPPMLSHVATGSSTNTTRHVTKSVPFHRTGTSITKATILRAAWAILLASYCDTDDICFGTTVSGRQAPLRGLESMAGPTVATIPVRIKLDRKATIGALLDQIQKQASETIPYEQFGLQNISKISPEAREVCDFSSLLVIQPASSIVESSLFGGIGKGSMQNYFDFPLLVQAQIQKDSVDLVFSYDSGILEKLQILAFSEQYNHVVQQLLSEEGSLLECVSVSGSWDLEQAVRWNSGKNVDFVNECVHDLIAEQVKRVPTREAIFSTGRRITYAELDDLSTRLACHLSQLGIGLETAVPICFEKSPWTVVAMLGIIKAGGAFLPLDPTSPLSRRQGLVDEVGAGVVMVSPAQLAISEGLAENIVVLSELFLLDLPTGDSAKLPKVSPNNAIYIFFTSGSTGKPKGILIEHVSVSVTLLSQARMLGLDETTRPIQFANYIFDVCISEILGTLILGGTICVPTEAERLYETASFIRDADVNMATLTPSFARTLNPAQVPSLKTLVVGGDAMTKDVLEMWCGRLTFVNGYGPTEACIYCTSYFIESPEASPTVIGHGYSCDCWIVDANDHQKLAPIGCVGELVISGHVVARGYVNNEEVTKKSFLDGVDWLAQDSTVRVRFYKTGDLARYTPEGEIELIGRRDMQVKIHGRRIELGEIEAAIKTVLPDVAHMAAEMIPLPRDTLVGFVCFPDEVSNSPDGTKGADDLRFCSMDDDMRKTLAALADGIKGILPTYMVPSVFLPLRSFPFMSSLKLDRKKLRSLAIELSADQLAEYSLKNQDRIPPSTEMEFQLRDLWAQVLKIRVQDIGKNDSFLQIGGDSISAIEFATLAQKNNIGITVAKVFELPQLAQLAAAAAMVVGEGAPAEEKPFSMLPRTVSLSAIQQQCGLSAEWIIEDSYPCTALQEGLIALAEKQPGSYVAKQIYRLPAHTEISRFEKAWDTVVEACGNLRTRITRNNGLSMQSVVKLGSMREPVEDGNPHVVMKAIESAKMGYGTALCRYALVQDGGEWYFILMMHHAIFDGWGMELIFEFLDRAYKGAELPELQSFAQFIKYTESIDDGAAKQYWSEQLMEAKRAVFPPPMPVSSEGSSKAGVIRHVKRSISFRPVEETSITKATVIRAAWAILLAKYSDTNDVCFGTTVSGRQAPVSGLESISGPTVATVPIRVKMDKEKSIADFLQATQTQASEMVTHEQFGLQNIAKLSPEAKDACDFSSLLIVQPSSSPRESILSGDGLVQDAMQNYFNYPLLAQGCIVDKANIELILSYNSDLLDEAQIVALSNQFEHILQQLLCSTSEVTLGTVSVVGPWDLQQATYWNSQNDFEVFDACVHELIAKQMEQTPSREAIYSSERSMTYAELDAMSANLAYYLAEEFGVGPETIVPICFEKSVWAVVAILGIMRAGGVFMPLDPSHPFARRQALVDDVGAQTIVVSPTQYESRELAKHGVVLSESLLSRLPRRNGDPSQLPQTNPSNAVHVIFTSGSTGKPKGILALHSALSISLVAQAKAFGMNKKTRFLQFAAFVFDISITEVLGTLLSGGTICIPTDEERMVDIALFMSKSRANLAFITPTLARTIDPKRVPTLKTLIVGGEPSGRDVQELWFGRLNLMNSYGPAEVSVCCCYSPVEAVDAPPSNIGQPFNCDWWVVDPEDHNQLTPVGCIGELLLHGHVVSRGYVNNEEATRNAFIGSVDWLPHVPGDKRRFYKTGDLVRYKPDGSMEIVGRRDKQVKVRGRRVELGEIEASIKKILPVVEHAAVELMPLKSRDGLVAFICLPTAVEDVGDSAVLEVTAELRHTISVLADGLQGVLPSYMVPSIFVPLGGFPFMISMKVDRARLRSIAEGLTTKQLAEFSLASQEKVAPSSPMELKLRELWATILRITLDEIGLNDSFLQIGGDSISAIELVALARGNGIGMTVTKIFEAPQLARMAAAAEMTSGKEYEFHAEPFSMLSTTDIDAVLSQIKEQCGLLTTKVIMDAYPCTPLQEGFMTLAETQSGSYTARHLYRIPQHVDVARFKAAWETTVDHCDNLRTRIALIRGSPIQAIFEAGPGWEAVGCGNPRKALKTMEETKMRYGSALCRYALVECDGQHYFAWAIHHSVYDGWSMGIVLDTLSRAYHGTGLSKLQPYANFIKYRESMNIAMASEFWRNQLNGASKASFPLRQAAGLEPQEPSASLLRKTVSLSGLTETSITKATIIRAAWAIVLARYCETDDICFGTTVSGRHAPISGLDKMPGPMIATVPVRARLDRRQPVSVFLQELQTQASDMVAYEQFGLQNISKLSQDAKEACDFSSLLVIQPANTSQADDATSLLSSDSETGLEEAVQNFFNYPVVAQAFLSDDSVELLFAYDSELMEEAELQAFSEQFDHVMQQLLTQDTDLGDVSLVGPWDIEHATRGNDVKTATESCTHWLIEEQMLRQPDAPAVTSWDRDLTYKELGELASKLARKLQELGVGPEVLVPLCFPKSTWAIVTMMAVQLAGGAFVPLDLKAPPARLKSLLDEIRPCLVLVGSSCQDVMDGLGVRTWVVEEEALRRLEGSADVVPTAQPGDTSFTIFTSGSTGRPKGVVVPHNSICSSADAYGAELGIGPGTRVFQFSAYTFDVAILDILVTLMRGGCVCVPSDEARIHDLSGAINSTGANWVFLTPTVANLLNPVDVPGLKVVCLGGEAVTETAVARWKGAVELHGLYGPAESSICSWNPKLGKSGKSTNIGSPLSSAFWVVEQMDLQQLVPVGCVGELLIQGPLLARGYMNADEASASNWLENAYRLPGADGRGYLTGDLVRRNVDGTFEYMGRKDAQIKVHGQRMEPAEIEYHVKKALPGAEHVVVDVVRYESTESLVAFVSFGDGGEEDMGSLAANLGTVLPAAMIPAYFIPIQQMPLTSSGKLDRKALREKATSMSATEILEYGTSRQSTFRDCSTELETKLRVQWSKVLDIPESSISVDDNFYHLGGDSIRIVSLAQRVVQEFEVSLGLSLINSKNTTVSGMAKVIDSKRSEEGWEEVPDVDLMEELASFTGASWDLHGLLAHSVTTMRRGATVFLTGATGYLGTEILRSLLRSVTVASVIVLVRAKSVEHGLERIKRTADVAQWWRPDDVDKVEVWVGDLGRSHMGLEDGQLERLSGQSTTNSNIDAIIHNGAVVNWNADYEKLRAANVESTVDLLLMTAASPVFPKFVYVSGGIKNEVHDSIESFASEVSTHNGYSRTKFMSESIVDNIASRLPANQNRLSIVKPGLIIGRAETGVANIDDFLWRAVAAGVMMQSFPWEAEDPWWYMAEVDAIAATVTGQVFAADSIAKFIDMRDGMRMSKFLELVNQQLDRPLTPVPREDWIKRATVQMNEVGEDHPLWAVHHFVGTRNMPAQRPVGYESSEEMYRAVGSNVRYLKSIGFISSTEGVGRVKGAVLGRSDMAAFERLR